MRKQRSPRPQPRSSSRAPRARSARPPAPRRDTSRRLLVRLLIGSSLALLIGLFVLSLWGGGESGLSRRVRSLIPGQVVKVLVVEGATGFDVARKLEELEVCPEAEFLRAFSDPELLASLEIPFPTAEGYLAPATYEFFRNSKADKVLTSMVRRRALDFAALGDRSPPEPLTTREELLVLASMVEAEARFPEERARIAAVFVNRLRDLQGETRGRLQSDPSAAYGCRVMPVPSPACQEAMSEGRIRVTPALLRESANPYNTYRHAGLPPGPIGNPGRASLLAALSPALTDELYFVSDGAGRHKFAASYAEHQKNVAELGRLRATNAPPSGEKGAEALPGALDPPARPDFPE